MKTRTYAFWHFLLAFLVRCIFLVIPHDRKNEPLLSDGPYIVCSNHISALDPILICSVLKRQQPRFMAKKELFTVPVLGKIISAWGAYSVDRGGADAGVLLKTVKMINDGCTVGIFPQGTRRTGLDPADTPVRNGIGLICEHTEATVLPIRIITKKNKMRFLRPVHIVVGQPVKYSEYTRNGEMSKDCAYISKYLFSKVCSLGDNDKLLSAGSRDGE